MATDTHTPRLALTVVEAGERIGVKRTTMYKLIRDGEIESFTIGRLRKVDPAELDAYIKRRSAVARAVEAEQVNDDDQADQAA
jgi:excisionase family DNA binding protein